MKDENEKLIESEDVVCPNCQANPWELSSQELMTPMQFLIKKWSVCKLRTGHTW